MDHKSQPPLYSFNTSVSDHVRLVSTCEKVIVVIRSVVRYYVMKIKPRQLEAGYSWQLSLLLTILVTKFGVLDIIMYVEGLIGWFFHFCLWF